MWNPKQYQQFGDERSRPFFDLVGRITTPEAGLVVDLGCGPGPLTATLNDRWPTASVIGIDSDAAMLDAARRLAHERLRFEHGDIDEWTPPVGIDVIVANASLQWAPNHPERLPLWIDALTPGGSLAFQVPGNFDDPHHAAIRAQVASPLWRDVARLPAIVGQRTHGALLAGGYLDLLRPLASVADVDAWETTYVHILQGDDPVLEWVKGTALRPVLALLDTDEQRNDFCAELGQGLRVEFPRRDWGTAFPFRRVFVVTRRA